MHRRHSRRLLLAIAAVLLVAACGGNSGEPTASSPEPIATATLTASSASPPAPTRLPPTVEMVAASAGLDASKLTLEVFYPISAPVGATLRGAPGAAPNGATIMCRSTAADGRMIGSARASPIDGSF